MMSLVVRTTGWTEYFKWQQSSPQDQAAIAQQTTFSNESLSRSYMQWFDFAMAMIVGEPTQSMNSGSNAFCEQSSGSGTWATWSPWSTSDGQDCTLGKEMPSSNGVDVWVTKYASTSATVQHCVIILQKWGDYWCIPSHWQPSPKGVAYSGLGSAFVCLTLFILYQMWRQRELKTKLQEAQIELEYLRDKVLQEKTLTGHQKEVRIFMDGAFDLMHFGHMNAFRLGKSLGTHLVVGLNSDESITKCKGTPLMNDEERNTMVSACKFVDEVVPDVPYIMSREYIDYIIEKYNIDYVVHGDDPCIVDGKDVYATAKERGKYRSIPRTEGVSTTDIVGRMLLMTKEHHFQSDLPLGQQSKFLTTSRMLQLFSQNVRAPPANARIVYIDGAWDVFHPGHVSILKAAREVSVTFSEFLSNFVP
jgi:cytidyltransferase-like protein